MKRSALTRFTALRPGKPPARATPLRKRSRAKEREDRARAKLVRQLVAERGPLCQVKGCGRAGVHPHHLLMKSQGGTDTAGNLILVCAEHHRAIHDNPEQSYANGRLIRSWDTKGRDEA